MIKNIVNYFRGLRYYHNPPEDFIPEVISQPPRFFKPKFDKHYIISDESFNYHDFNVQTFLQKKKSCLADFTCVKFTAAQIIHDAADKFNINPKLLLVSLEKERGLISQRELPPLSELDFALNFGWSREIGGIPIYSGFDRQIYLTAKAYRKWFNYAGDFKKVGKKIKCVDDTVLPENSATYSLYRLSPYVGNAHIYFKRPVQDMYGNITDISIKLRYRAPFGNYLLFLLWSKWWPKDFK